LNPSGKTGNLIPYVRLRSKLSYQDISKYATYFSKNWEIKKPLLSAPKRIKREFLRAFFDDEGSVTKQGNKGIIKLYSINLSCLFLK